MKETFNLPEMLSEVEEKTVGQGKLRAEIFLDEATLSTPWALRVLMVLSEKLKRGELKGIEKIVRVDTKDPAILCQREKDFYEQIKIVKSLTDIYPTPWAEVGERIGNICLRLLWLKTIRLLISGFEPHGHIKRLWDDEEAIPWIWDDRTPRELQDKMKAKFRVAEDEFYVWRNKLVEGNLRLSIWQAGRILGKRSLLERAVGQEAIQEGNIGLMIGADYWNCTRGVRFGTYATPWVKTCIIRYLQKNTNVIRLPHGYQEQIFRIKKICAEENEEISVEEIALKADLSEDKIGEIMRDWKVASQTITIVKGREGQQAGEIWEEKLPGTVASADEKIAEEDIARVGMEAMEARLSPKQKLCLQLRFGTHFMTLEEVTGTMGTTRERIRQIQNIALTRLRTKL